MPHLRSVEKKNPRISGVFLFIRRACTSRRKPSFRMPKHRTPIRKREAPTFRSRQAKTAGLPRAQGFLQSSGHEPRQRSRPERSRDGRRPRCRPRCPEKTSIRRKRWTRFPQWKFKTPILPRRNGRHFQKEPSEAGERICARWRFSKRRALRFLEGTPRTEDRRSLGEDAVHANVSRSCPEFRKRSRRLLR